MMQDFRYALRNLRRSPLFTLVAVLSLALGIGANSAIFTIADQVLLRLLPVQHAGELVFFTSDGPQTGMVWGQHRFSYPMYQDFRDHPGALTSVAARFNTQLSVAFGNRSEQVNGELVSGTYFDTMGLGIALGRGLGPEDDRTPGGHPVTVLTYDFWKSHFGADPSILNQTIRVNEYPLTVVGVAAPGYRGFDVGERTDLLVPTMMKAQMTPTLERSGQPPHALAATDRASEARRQLAAGAGQPGAVLPLATGGGTAGDALAQCTVRPEICARNRWSSSRRPAACRICATPSERRCASCWRLWGCCC